MLLFSQFTLTQAATIATFKCKPKQHLFITSNIKIARILQITPAESVCNGERVANAYGIDAILFSFPASSQLNSECNPKRNFSQSSHVD